MSMERQSFWWSTVAPPPPPAPPPSPFCFLAFAIPGAPPRSSSSCARVWKLLEGVGRRPVGLSEVWWCRGTPRHPEAGLCDARGEPWPVYKPGWTGARRRSSPSRLRSFAAPVKGGSVDPVHGLRWGTGASARVNI